ncbi:caspase, EACC1-associated type [Nocardia donostiensis]|uniref:Caspase family p20 domain-containing protein n=1 Tax=Nocardia donostiensis TaxID=1538463 RepID=A0A1V2TFD5_9NOCA|nr:AAA domain-containing protein [Nocardia donostiensis]ONM48194.1 hypothetical protein B0T46_14550 [Nocardia donostiensis]OQS13815.1 hypothetical protein B0T36_16835 [Nocardia donostiensis]OQS17690.1 hypothetical protein B0T44_23490 [Nocardia donostiensis]
MTRLARRRALLIGTQTYQHPDLADLPAVRADLTGMDEVLSHREIGGFPDVLSVVDLTADQMRDTLSAFLSSSGDDELSLVYYSGHGLRTPDTGEFHFIATDTDPADPRRTAVCAGFVNDLLDYRCLAPQRVVIIDSCYSGGYVLGFRTSTPVPTTGNGTISGAKGSSGRSGKEPTALLHSSGCYIVSSSRSLEQSFQGATPSDPSVFTGVLVDALRTGEAGRNGPEVSVSDVFEYVNGRLCKAGSEQTPVISSNGVDGRIILASRPRKPIALTDRRQPTPGTELPGSATKSAALRWPQLIDYYIRCLRSESNSWLSADDLDKTFVCLRGRERLLVGDLDSDHSVPVPAESEAFLGTTATGSAQLWAGYPVVAINSPVGGRRGRSDGQWKIAPLLMRRLDIVEDVRGRRLLPVGPPVPHPALLRACMSEEDAAHFAADYRPTWHAGGRTAMTTDVRNLLRDDFAIDEVQELDPETLADHVDIHTPTPGARNAAILFRMADDGGPNRSLLADLGDIADKRTAIGRTALSALLPDSVAPTEKPRPRPEPRMTTPLACNELQEEVIRSSMTRKLTVATGPPGTGKSQLVVNLVATALANDQTVLVASTNNRAVDEIVDRCQKLVPGSVIRTGSREYSRERQDLASLTALLPGENQNTVAAQTDRAMDELRAHHMELDRAARHETRLLAAARRRDSIVADLATHLGIGIDAIDAILHDADLIQLRRRAAFASYSPLFATARCDKLLQRLGLPPSSTSWEICKLLAQLATAEIDWRTAWHAGTATADDHLVETGRIREEAARTSSIALVDSVVRAKATAGRSLITTLLNSSNGRTWRPRADVLQAAPGWAVTALSARNFPPEPALFDLVVIDEASQCAIPAVLPLMFRAERALVIGDPMQLTHITTLDGPGRVTAERFAGVAPSWLEQRKLDYQRHSAFHAADHAAGAHTVLDEHYRCHPKIAATANELFYQGRLRILTDTRDRPTDEAITWHDVRGQATRQRWGSWVNDAEVDAVSELIGDLVRNGVRDLGVITPYRDQATALSRALKGFGIGVGTVHAFQGGEHDVIIFSLVASDGMPTESIGWLDRQPNLWNVAITRARKRLYVVGDRRVWRTRYLGSELIRAAGTGSAQIAAPDDLWSRLRDRATDPSIDRLEFAVAINAYSADAVAHHDDGSTSAYLLDRGCGEDAPGRHLRLMLRRTELIGDPRRSVEAYRIPAWRMYS